jgi:predicted peptidase
MYTFIIAATVLLAAGESEPELLALFEFKEFHYTGGHYEHQAIHYRLFDPRTDESDARRFPLIVWLHGSGDGGYPLRWVSGRLMSPPFNRERFPFFVLAPECPPDNSTWHQGETAVDDDMLSVTAAIVDATLDNYPIDRDRISMVGISGGAGGSWILASRRPDLFAAIAPLSANRFLPTPDHIAALKQMRIWAFNCRDDKACPIEPIRASVQTLAEAGVNVHLSEIEAGPNHDSWSGAFGDYGLREWLLAQRRGDSSQLGQPIVSAGRENVGFVRAMVRGTLGDFFHDLFWRWSWSQLPIVVYLTLVVGVLGRWTFTHVRIVRKNSPRSSAIVDLPKD